HHADPAQRPGRASARPPPRPALKGPTTASGSYAGARAKGVAVSEHETGERTVHFHTCPLCEATCGLQIEMDGDKVHRIRGARGAVFSKGSIRPKGSSLKQLHEDPDRLRHPLVRRDGELVEATWEEAWAAVADGLGRVWADGDRNAVALYLGNPSAHTIAG